MPRGGKKDNKGGAGQPKNKGNKKAAGQPKNKGNLDAAGQKENIGNLAGQPKNKGNRKAAGQPRNKGGAAPNGNSNSSSRRKKVLNLFKMGSEFDRQHDYINAILKYREVLELEPEHPDANYCIARLLFERYNQNDFVNSGSFARIIDHFKIAESGGCKIAKNSMIKLLFNGEHGENGECKPNPDNYKEILDHHKLLVSEAEVELQTSPTAALLIASSLTHNLLAEVLIMCSTTENFPANIIFAESESRIAVAQNPSSSKVNIDLASVLMKRNDIAGAIDCLKTFLIIRPNHSEVIERLKILEKQVTDH
jgi:tetratricopeptide (TPR) repeat protein